jgi:hypothetical protein
MASGTIVYGGLAPGVTAAVLPTAGLAAYCLPRPAGQISSCSPLFGARVGLPVGALSNPALYLGRLLPYTVVIVVVVPVVPVAVAMVIVVVIEVIPA